MPNVQRLCTARAAAKARALGLLVSYVTLANGCFAGARQTLTVFTGPASKHLTLKVPTSHQFNPESSSLTPTVPPMETPPIHVLLALDAQILGGRVDAEISTESTPTVTESSAGDEGSSPPPSPPPPGAPINVRTVGGREAIVLEKMQRGWFRVELDGNANDEGGARERKLVRRTPRGLTTPPW